MPIRSTTPLIGERVQVYWNLHKNCYSVHALSGPERGRVAAHTFLVDLADVTFAVQPAGRQRIVDGEPKNVHAFIRGTVVGSLDGVTADYTEVKYNPYKYSSFVRKPEGSAISEASIVRAYTDNQGRPVIMAA